MLHMARRDRNHPDRHVPVCLNRLPDRTLLTAGATDRLFLLNAAQLALGYVPALAANRAQDAALGDLLAETLEQLLLRFIRS
jgi:hypothetical protein